MTVLAEQMAYVGFFFDPNPQLIAVDGFLPVDLGVIPPLAEGGNLIELVGRANLVEVAGANSLTVSTPGRNELGAELGGNTIDIEDC